MSDYVMKRKGQPKEKKAGRKTKRTGDYQRGRELAKAPKTELKAFDLAQTNQNFTVAGTTQVLNAVVNGPELYQRVGRKIYARSLHIRGLVQNIATATQDLGRIMIIYDSQTNANAPALALAQILQDSNAGAATSGTSEINLTNRQRFKILRDYQVLLPSCTNTAGVLTNYTISDPIKNSFNIDLFIKLKGLETIYNATNGGTIADITSGSIFLLLVSNAVNNAWSLIYSSRLRYYD